MTDAGFPPSVLLLPVNFRLLREMELPYAADEGAIPAEWKLGEDARSGFRGAIEGVLVPQLPDVPDEALYPFVLAYICAFPGWAVLGSNQ